VTTQFSLSAEFDRRPEPAVFVLRLRWIRFRVRGRWHHLCRVLRAPRTTFEYDAHRQQRPCV